MHWCTFSLLFALSHETVGLSQSTVLNAKHSSIPALQDFDYEKNDRIPWVSDGYATWEWKGNKINYIEMGDRSKPAILLIHGFGASAYHWRCNIPDLAKDYHVYAFDKLGFGLSSKPIQDYSAEVWRDQTIDFVEEIIGKPVVVAGNSIGGFTALYAAAAIDDRATPLFRGCVLLNAAGRFRDPESSPENTEEIVEKKNPLIENILGAIKRAVIMASFAYTKRPERIEQVLKQVYPVHANIVDKDLVESIQIPSFDPNAGEVFYRVIERNGSAPPVYIDDLLKNFNKPLLLAWGEKDPWIRPAAADKIQALYPSSKRVSINAGHCPHDEDPAAVNDAIRNFMEEIAVEQ